MVANINFDGANIWGRTRDVTLVGAGKSTLDRWVEAAAESQDRSVGDDPFPERGSFYRSDQFNFARIGVPALFLGRGTDFVGRPPEWGRTQMEGWVAAHYHQPSDDFDPATWDFTGMVDDTRLAFAIGLALARSGEMPTWLPGDEFEQVRARSLALGAR
jgi:Zn-dependent M28 family amino/carboxypeptidase